MKTKAFILAILALVATACDDFLEPVSLSTFDRNYVFSNVDDARRGVNAIYVHFSHDGFRSRLSNNMTGNTDIEHSSGWTSSGARYQIWDLNAQENNGDLQFVWEIGYQAIRDANIAIEGLRASGTLESEDVAERATMNHLLGEAYTRNGKPAKIVSPTRPGEGISNKQKARGVLAEMYPLPTWHVIPPGDVFRVFERGGRTINSQFPEIGLPNPTGQIQRLEEPGRPDLKQSNRGPGTGLRVAIPALNIHKTRLNDPFTWFMGTNDQPGDYRHSGCASCHVVYANDREPRHSLIYAKYGRDGQTITLDPTIAEKYEKDDGHGYGEKEGHKSAGHAAVKQPGVAYEAEPALDAAGGMKNTEDGLLNSAGKPKEKGHPLQHVFTRAIPTSQCMNCHMHQPNIFLNSYLGYTMWDYESDAPHMWPKDQKYPTAEEVRKVG